jgi:predicted TIM-barrel fold metal-dependent hydrolase
MTSTEYIQVTHRELPFSTFDADNHLYENRDALTKFLPDEYKGIVRYVDIDGRTKLAIQDKISDYIPNPTFNRVAVPGGAGMDVTKGGEGFNRPGAGAGFGKMVVMPGVDAFFDPEPRLELMKEMGIDRTLLWPTLASALEERMANDPDAVCAVIHALNQWMHEHWTYVYSDAIFSTPIISLAAGNDVALAELEYVAERGARLFLIRVAPVPTWKGRKSFALPEFDPFWERVQEAGILVGMHASDSGYQRYLDEWEGVSDGEFTPFKGGSGFALIAGSGNRPIVDAMSSIVGHGLSARFPDVRFAPVENGTGWVKSLLSSMQHAYAMAPQAFEEHPVDAFKRSVALHPFHEDDPKALADLVGFDNVLFGSDYPHPEGMADPITYVDRLDGFDDEGKAKIMGGNLARLMGIDDPAKVA